MKNILFCWKILSVFACPIFFLFSDTILFHAHIIKVTRDAEIDIDNDISTSLIQKIEKGLKNRKKGKPVRFVFDKDIDPSLLTYLGKTTGTYPKRQPDTRRTYS